jgi:hypothetical protein
MHTAQKEQKRVTVSMTMAEDLRASVVAEADTERRPLSWVVEDLLREALEARRAKAQAVTP